ncbi:hypothetical protein [Streptomyces sp. NPDC092903]|uniref:hypothetical protein n=1 Tax=Streptomyces sp. NPDC092903 TaxID=3366017 RepID=UPI00381BEF94
MERPHPGAQFRFTDLGGLRLTCSATNTGRRHWLPFTTTIEAKAFRIKRWP